MSTDYKASVFLPKTDFPMRAGLPQKEPEILARWAKIGLYDKVRRQSKGRTKYVLHDGPPYANGNLHMGHATNKVLKDVVTRTQQMLGRDSIYVPGWDCHGLPIEWKIEEKYRADGKDKDQVPVLEFRQECRDFARHWVGVQSEQFQRLGVMGDWQNPYLTMTYPAEATIVGEIHKFLLNGRLYKGVKPVMWSTVEKTALAEAEVEYHEKTSTMVWVRFPVVKSADPALTGASMVIWTTTPWTLPGNRAIAYGPDFAYAAVKVTEVAENSLARVGEVIVVAADLVEAVAKAAKITGYDIAARLPGTALAGTVCAHPWRGQGYDYDVPLLPGSHVTTDAGTGLVHTAPAHGEEDFLLGVENGLDIMTQPVEDDGRYGPGVPLWAGIDVFEANSPIFDKLKTEGALLAGGRLKHQYPHSWRSKAPLIYRTTPQWFIGMDTTPNGAESLRDIALRAIEDTKWYPAAGKNRIGSMIESRPDWCISRQRAWGVPIALFLDKRTGEPLRDEAVCNRITAAFREKGSDAWYSMDPQEFLGNEYNKADYDQVFDIVDVWFESGSTHNFVLEARPDLKWPADLYLEGSDQHRGWFHSSLLESCGTRGRAPYDAVLTHGFVLDQNGYKMSKSLGNGVEPSEIEAQYGADILRLWVVSSDYSEDLRIGPDILKSYSDLYRRLRNTLRYLLGALDGWDGSAAVKAEEMPELERWALHRLSEMDAHVRACVARYDFNSLYRELHEFCAVELSAFYFDVRKDVLYCDGASSLRRRATLTVMNLIFEALTAWLAPALCFTAEEAWLTRTNGWESEDSVHLRLFPEFPAEWRNEALAAKWETIRRVRRVVTGALEVERGAKRIGSSLQAAPEVYVDPDTAAVLGTVAFHDVCITSAIKVLTGTAPEGAFTLPEVAGVAVMPTLAEGERCERCWQVLPDVGSHDGHDHVCGRCADALDDPVTGLAGEAA
jgi:isoleucyl-tRNA synthetase